MLLAIIKKELLLVSRDIHAVMGREGARNQTW